MWDKHTKCGTLVPHVGHERSIVQGPQKDFTKLIRQLRKNGYVVEMRKGGHYAVMARDGQRLVTLPASTSDHRAIKNARALLRRNGISYEPKCGKPGRTQPKLGE